MTLIQCPFYPCVTAEACKRHWSFCQKCRWQVTIKHTYTLDPVKLVWAHYAAVQAYVGTYLETSSQVTLSGNIQPQLSQLTKPLWTDPGIKSGICVHKLISTSKEKKAHAGNEWLNILPKSSQVRTKPPPAQTLTVAFSFLLRLQSSSVPFSASDMPLSAQPLCNPPWKTGLKAPTN